MADEVKWVDLPVEGRILKIREPDPEQILAWMGLLSDLTGDLSDVEQSEVTESVTLIMDAVLGLFQTDDDRRWFRRAAVLGKTKLSDALRAIMSEMEDVEPEKPKARVRRAR